MAKAQNEIRIIWLMLLTIVTIAAWFLNVHLISYVCVLALVISVMQYVDLIQKPTQDIAVQLQQPVQANSKVPLYLASLLAIVGGIMSWHWLTAFGMSVWIFFFLRWLRRLEQQLNNLNRSLSHFEQSIQIPKAEIKPSIASTIHTADAIDSNLLPNQTNNHQQAVHPHAGSHGVASSTQFEAPTASLDLAQQLRQWIFHGNPVLKAAISILLIGIILLLRFATEHWQLELALQLSIIAGISLAVYGLGYRLLPGNRGFGLGLEGLGQAGLFLTLFFAYYNQVIASFTLAAVLFSGIMLLSVWLSLKQNAIELALMTMLMAYIAPFTLPVRELSSLELISYYWCINLAIAVISSLRPWKILHHLAFICTLLIATSYALYRADFEKLPMLILILAHSLIFIWQGFRYSQLLAKQDLAQFKLKPVLDVAMIFGAPLLAYILIYLLYFQQAIWQATLSLGFAGLFAILYQWAKRLQSIAIIANSYLSLTLIFLSLIPPILLPEQWSVMGWAMEAVLVFIYALSRRSVVSHALAMALLSVAGLSSVYYVLQLDSLPQLILWSLSFCFAAVVVLGNSRAVFREQYSTGILIFQSVLMFFSSMLFLVLLTDQFPDAQARVPILLAALLVLAFLNEVLSKCGATWTWFMPKYLALTPINIFAIAIIGHQYVDGAVQWSSNLDHWGFSIAALLSFLMFIRPRLDFQAVREPLSFGALISLSLASIGLWPAMPEVSGILLPLLYCAWCFKHRQREDVLLIWMSKSSLLLMMAWMIASQLFAKNIFQGYWLPLLNPVDIVSLLGLAAFLWMLSLQLKTQIDRGILAILAVLSVLWLSSYILLRGLHFYLDTPYNQLALWQDAGVQLSLTLLWVSLAFVSMTLATKKKIRALWILGASLLVIVTLKLVLLDLSHIGTLLRVCSFLGAGLIMLLIAYIAPMPEAAPNAHNNQQ